MYIFYCGYFWDKFLFVLFFIHNGTYLFFQHIVVLEYKNAKIAQNIRLSTFPHILSLLLLPTNI